MYSQNLWDRAVFWDCLEVILNTLLRLRRQSCNQHCICFLEVQAEGQNLPGSSIFVERLELLFPALRERFLAWILGCFSSRIQSIAGSRSSPLAHNYSLRKEERTLAGDSFRLLLQLSVIYTRIFCCMFCLSMHTNAHLPDFVSLHYIQHRWQNLTTCPIPPIFIS